LFSYMPSTRGGDELEQAAAIAARLLADAPPAFRTTPTRKVAARTGELEHKSGRGESVLRASAARLLSAKKA
jgi:hypothetical protein